jgi:pilus assembly protein CpaF
MVSIEELLRIGTLTPYMARFLSASVKAKLNIIVCGGTGSGKTTLLNILSGFIGDDERIITIEDAAELRLYQNHVISLETRTTNYQRGNEVTIRDLVINALRMRPDRIIIGEVRGAEAFDLLQAMNTGHEGSLTTLHANNTKDALNRLETMVLMDGLEIPIPALKEYICNAVDIIVFISRMKAGKRKITNISELNGVVDGSWDLNSIFEFNAELITEDGQVHGSYVQNKGIPKCIAKIIANGINDLTDIFKPNKK